MKIRLGHIILAIAAAILFMAELTQTDVDLTKSGFGLSEGQFHLERLVERWRPTEDGYGVSKK